MAAVTIIILSLIIGFLSYFFVRCEKTRNNADKLSGPKSLPIIGNIHQLKRDPVEFTKQLFDYMVEYGPNKAFRMMIGTCPFLYICRAEEAELLLSGTKHIDKTIEYRFVHPWIGTGLLTSTGEKWKTRRKLLTPSFHFKILHDFVGVFNKQAQILCQKLERKAEQNPEINVFSDITLCALDIICETAMGRSVDAQGNEESDYVQAVHRASNHVITRARSPWLWPEILYYMTDRGRDFKKCLATLHGFTEQVIRERQADFLKIHDQSTTIEDLLNQSESGSKRKLAFLDMLLCASADGEKLTFPEIREEVDTFMFEGHDTTANAVNWALHLIGCDTTVQLKVHEELDSIFGNSTRAATVDDLKKMVYLECCIKESLRIFPSAPIFGRQLAEDTSIVNVDFPKGTAVLISVYAIHRDTHIYPDPEKFDPGRFLSEGGGARHPFSFIPFSAGQRNCIGQKFALLEEKVILSTILRKFRIQSLQTREELFPVMDLILRPAYGIKLSLSKRS